MTYIDPFIYEKSIYDRQVNPLLHCKEDMVYYLSKIGNKKKEDIEKYLDEKRKNQSIVINKPLVAMTEKDSNGDRVKVESKTLNQYLRSAIKNDWIIAPTLTCYLPETEKKAYLVDFTLDNIANRSKEKKAMFRYEMQGDTLNATIKANSQNNYKISNNSISGASCVASTPIYNPTMHSSLTSTCRVTAAYANSNNEKLLGGNRHYYSPEVTLNNIVSICNRTDLNKIEKVMEKYHLHYPSVDETMDVVLRSSRQYWKNSVKEKSIYRFISTLTPLERAAFVYVSDLYQLKVYNDAFMRTLITRLSEKHPVDPSITNPLQINKEAPETIFNLAGQICKRETIGIDMALDTNKESDVGKLVASNVIKLYQAIEDYRDFFIAFFRTPNLPSSIAPFKDSIRHVVLMSDTDSTIFTVEEWVEWYLGKIDFSDEANAVFAAMVFLSVSTLKHILAQMSANIGVNKDRIHLIAMKNEFKFEVFVPTLNTKHYYALITYQEGNMYKNPKMEIKGVHLKNSNAPISINKQAASMMREICEKVIRGEKLSLKHYCQQVADTEYDIKDHVLSGKSTYYRLQMIKDAKAYQQGETESLYKHHLFWNATFGKIYGKTQEPPYLTYKVTLNIKNKTDMQNYLKTLPSTLASDIGEFLKGQKSDHMTTFYVPVDLFTNTPLPKEIVSIVDIRKMQVDIAHTLYYILGTLGVFMLNKYHTRLLSDIYPQKDTPLLTAA